MFFRSVRQQTPGHRVRSASGGLPRSRWTEPLYIGIRKNGEMIGERLKTCYKSRPFVCTMRAYHSAESFTMRRWVG